MKSKTGRKSYLFIIPAAVLLLLFLVIVLRDMHMQDSGDTSFVQGDTESHVVSFPFVSEDGILQITSLIQFDGPNADMDQSEVADIAGLQVVNISEQYIEEADVRLVMTDGQEYSFLIQDLPAGAGAAVFERSSLLYDGKTDCSDIECTAQTADVSLEEDTVAVRTDGAAITVTNISEYPIHNMTVIYRCMAEDIYIGGISYQIPVPELDPGDSFTYEDTACQMGTPHVVRIQETQK